MNECDLIVPVVGCKPAAMAASYAAANCLHIGGPGQQLGCFSTATPNVRDFADVDYLIDLEGGANHPIAPFKCYSCLLYPRHLPKDGAMRMCTNTRDHEYSMSDPHHTFKEITWAYMADKAIPRHMTMEPSHATTGKPGAGGYDRGFKKHKTFAAGSKRRGEPRRPRSHNPKKRRADGDLRDNSRYSRKGGGGKGKGGKGAKGGKGKLLEVHRAPTQTTRPFSGGAPPRAGKQKPKTSFVVPKP